MRGVIRRIIQHDTRWLAYDAEHEPEEDIAVYVA